jgi:alpha-L-arabinofuranosidase
MRARLASARKQEIKVTGKIYMRMALSILLAASVQASAIAQQVPAVAHSSAAGTLTLDFEASGPKIERDLFGQFAEHLGQGIYDGIWVGPDSSIPNVRGIRTDVVQALRALKVPVVRWPGGCFADAYNWRHGIGPASQRVTTVNLWGNVPEPNTFGTHEFMDFVDQIDSEAFVSVNLGSGTAAEAAEWLEYMTTNQPSTLGKLRAANGRAQPWKIKYLGLGNESWGCGGGFTGAEYVPEMKRFSTLVRNLNPAQNAEIPIFRVPDSMRRVAVGPDAAKTDYTEAVMKAWSQRGNAGWGIEALSLHFYSAGPGGIVTAPSTGFGEKDYAYLLKDSLRIQDMIATHSAIMDKYDPKREVALVVDEWGAWLRPLPGLPLMFLKQQNSQRDAILASLNLNIFARNAARVRMANIAQMVNVIQSMILTDGNKMVLTPTYYVYKMYVPFQDAQLIPLKLEAGQYTFGDITMPGVDAIAARDKQGRVWLALTNLDPNHETTVVLNRGKGAISATGEVLTAAKVDTVNTFEAPGNVTPRPYAARGSNGRLALSLPAKSVTVVQLTGAP